MAYYWKICIVLEYTLKYGCKTTQSNIFNEDKFSLKKANSPKRISRNTKKSQWVEKREGDLETQRL